MFLPLKAEVNTSVAIGSIQHIAPLLFALVYTVGFIFYAKRNFTASQQEKAVHYFAWFVSLTVIIFHVYHMVFETYNFKTDLPFYLCSLLAIIIPIFTYYRKYWMFEILVFWIIGGTLQGIITPDIQEGFPSFDYFTYWITHLGLLIIICYVIFVFNMKPKLRSVFKSFLALQVYVILMMLLNYCLDANYFYLNEKPKSASLLDYFGEWPYYILVAQLIVIPSFLLIYLAFRLEKE